MASKNQLLDMTPIGMIFKVLKSATDTDGKSLDLHWELLPKCNTVKPMIHIHPHAIETKNVITILCGNIYSLEYQCTGIAFGS